MHTLNHMLVMQVKDQHWFHKTKWTDVRL